MAGKVGQVAEKPEAVLDLIIRIPRRVPSLDILMMAPEDENDPLKCPDCSGPMKIARVTPKFGGLPELRTYQCVECEEVVTVESKYETKQNE
jgi:hypothetical protein